MLLSLLFPGGAGNRIKLLPWSPDEAGTSGVVWKEESNQHPLPSTAKLCWKLILEMGEKRGERGIGFHRFQFNVGASAAIGSGSRHTDRGKGAAQKAPWWQAVPVRRYSRHA